MDQGLSLDIDMLGDLSERSQQSQASHATFDEALLHARALVTRLGQLANPGETLGIIRWLKLTQSVQDVAYIEPDSGGDAELAEWCIRQWHGARQFDPQGAGPLQGLGHAWLLKSQKVLAKIYHREGSPSSSSSEPKTHLGVPRKLSTEAEDQERINSGDYIEARTLLTPSVEFLDRALDLAEGHGAVNGRLLELAAEAYMSLGNVSHPRGNEQCYQKALQLLRRASTTEEYEMDPYLKAFLDENLDYMI